MRKKYFISHEMGDHSFVETFLDRRECKKMYYVTPRNSVVADMLFTTAMRADSTSHAPPNGFSECMLMPATRSSSQILFRLKMYHLAFNSNCTFFSW